MILTNLWIPLSHHICLTYKQPGAHLVGWHWKVSSFYTNRKRGGLGHKEWKRPSLVTFKRQDKLESWDRDVWYVARHWIT